MCVYSICQVYVHVSCMIVNHVRTDYISAPSTCRTSLKIIDDETIRHIIALGARPTPDRETLTILTIRRGSLTSTNCRTTNPVVDTGPAQDLRHHPDPPHTLTFSEPVTIDQSGDPTVKFHTRSMIRPDIELHPPSESVPELGVLYCTSGSLRDTMPTRHMSKIRNRGASLGRLWIRGRVWEATSRVGRGSGRDPRSGVDQVVAAGSAPECRTSPNLRFPSRAHIRSLTFLHRPVTD